MPSESGIIDGIPVGRLETTGLVLLAWIVAHRVQPAGGRVAAVVAVAAAIMSAAVPGDRGLNARYFATASANGAHERSIEYRDPAITRRDPRLEFTRGDRDFPLAFFNDHGRFNFMRAGEPDRRFLEFAVTWTGWWRIDGGPRELYLHAPKAAAQVSVDALPLLTSGPSSTDETRVVTLAEGWHRLHITFSSPYGAPREFAAGEVRDGVRVPFDTTNIRTERIDSRQLVIAGTLTRVKRTADLIALGWLSILAGGLLLRRVGEIWQRGVAAPEAGFALVVAAGAIDALRFAWPWADRLRLLVAGDDTITYETYARDILFNGILMNGGAPLGQGEPFYYQAFYPYFLAASHAIFGESVFGAIFLQRLMVVLTVVVLARMAMKLRGESIWPAALLVAGLFAWWKIAPISADLLNESLYVPLLAVWSASLLTFELEPSMRRAATSGAIGGLAAITRSTSMLSWVLVWPALWWPLRKQRGTRLVAMMAACSLAVFSLIAIRNALVSHQFVPTSTELGITLLGGNPPPPGLVMDLSARGAYYARLGIGGHTAEVIEYALAAPLTFAANMGRKALFALGFYEPYAEGWGYSPVYIATWISALYGAWLLRRGGTFTAAKMLPFVIAFTQYAAVVLVYPKGERLILPIHTLLIPYSAVAAAQLARIIGAVFTVPDAPASPATPASPR